MEVGTNAMADEIGDDSQLMSASTRVYHRADVAKILTRCTDFYCLFQTKPCDVY